MDPPCWGDADREEMNLLVLLLLKACPSFEPSSSEGMVSTPLPLSRGAGVGVWPQPVGLQRWEEVN